MSDMPKSVEIREEGPREGFQIEKEVIPTARKVEFINALAGTGLKHIQTVSFVDPRRVPNMADAEQVVEGIVPVDGIKFTGLWLNDRGFERAIATKKLTIEGGISLSASNAFLKRNQNVTIEELIARLPTTIAKYKEHGIELEGGLVSAAFGCNFEGEIPVERVVDLTGRLIALARDNGMPFKRLTLADTMGWATPASIKRVVDAVWSRFPDLDLVLHLHDTRGMGIANAYAGLEMGVRRYDAAVAGLGGCPFAGHKGAAGNVCTEDLVFMCHEMGIETGIDLEALIACANLAEDVVGHPLPGSVMKGGSLGRLREKVRAA
ncbi:MAG TPA: hydroxymethylglutaryl-CoA lyase [Stellaceae bacterium]|jgi:hydroxymethylglutaryl-CoA lyase|nr:hydroxymethylglutaryl-CoA lyase [Stellaceae bacterium]